MTDGGARVVREQEGEPGLAPTKAREIWDAASIDAERGLALGPYAAGLRVHAGELVIPMYNAAHEIANLGFISPDRKLHYLARDRISGCYYGRTGIRRDRIVVARKFSRASRIHEQGISAATAFTLENVATVAALLRQRHPTAQVVTEAELERDWPPPDTASDLERSLIPDSGSALIPDSENADQSVSVPLDPKLLIDQSDASKVLRWARRMGLTEFSKRQILQRGPSTVRRAEAANAAIQTPTAMGWLQPTDNNTFTLTTAAMAVLKTTS